MRTAKICSRGAREWFRKNDLPWQTFVSEGLPATVLEATGDHYAIKVAGIARVRVGGDHG